MRFFPCRISQQLPAVPPEGGKTSQRWRGGSWTLNLTPLPSHQHTEATSPGQLGEASFQRCHRSFMGSSGFGTSPEHSSDTTEPQQGPSSSLSSF